jgi:hypothetical protein
MRMTSTIHLRVIAGVSVELCADWRDGKIGCGHSGQIRRAFQRLIRGPFDLTRPCDPAPVWLLPGG